MPGLYIGLLAVFVYVWIKYSQKKDDTNDNLSGEGWTVRRLNDTIVSIPQALTQETAVIIGGMYQSDEEWMFNQIPEQIKRERNIIVGPYTQSVDVTMSEGSLIMAEELRTPQFTSLSGFSAGGYRVTEWWKPGQNMFDVVFLIDPALETSVIKAKRFDSRVILLYGSDPMENLYSENYAYLSNQIMQEGGIVENIEMYHYEYPSYTFQKYQFSL